MISNTLYQLERERRSKILNLKPDEVELYIDSLNKRMAVAYGNVANDFTPDMDATNKAADLCDEVVELLKKKYPNISSYTAWSRVNVLVSKLRETAEDVHDLKLKKVLTDFEWSCRTLGKELIILKYVMEIYYDFYICRGKYDNIFHLIDRTSLDEKDKVKVVNALDELPVYDFYNSFYMQSMDAFIRIMLKIMGYDYKLLKKLSNFTIDEETYDDEFFNQFRKDMLELQQEANDMLSEYDAFMDDGFHEAKEHERKILSEMWNESHDTANDYVDYIQYNRPSYDLKTMTFIPSQHELNKMAAYKESHDE